MDVISCLKQIANHLDISHMELCTAYELDRHTGAHEPGWPGMSVTTKDGRVIYAMVRVLRPQNMVEVGALGGCSAAHILQALVDNGEGNLISFDVVPIQPPGPPEELRSRWRFIQHDGMTYDFGDYRCDLFFEDAAHSQDSTRHLCRRALDLGARVVIVHDAALPLHPGTFRCTGEHVRRGIEDVFSRYIVVEPGDDSWGMAICRASDAKENAEPEPTPAPEPVAKPRRPWRIS